MRVPTEMVARQRAHRPRRDDLLKQHGATTTRLSWRLHKLDPTFEVKPGALRWRVDQDAVGAWLSDKPGTLSEMARAEVGDSNWTANAPSTPTKGKCEGRQPDQLSQTPSVTGRKIRLDKSRSTRRRSSSSMSASSGSAAAMPIPAKNTE